jgi:hypothetical protein
MMRAFLVAVVMTAAAVSATPAFAADLTPAGPATITPTWGPNFACAVTAIVGGDSRVLVGWSAQVGEGGQAGIVRPQFGATLGDPVELPAQPGTYTFPAPRIPWSQWCGPGPGLVQVTGEHAVVTKDAGVSANEYLLVKRDGQADERIDGARLAVTALTEPDDDRDLRGDTTEDRTDLRLAGTAAREADGRLRIEVTVTNAGPLSADRPVLVAPALVGGHWEGSCDPTVRYPACIAPLAVGESRAFVFRADAPAATSASFTVTSEGPDLAPADNTVTVSVPAAPAFDLTVAERQRLAKGVTAHVRGVRAGRTRVTVAFKLGNGKTVKVGKVVALEPYVARSVTVKATGAKLRSLKRAAKRGALSAAITARTFNGKSPVTAKTTVLR